MPVSSPRPQLHVVVVGGGIAALETVLALRDLAGHRVRVTLVAPGREFTMRPLAVAAPFSRGRMAALPLADLMAAHGGAFVRGAALAVDPAARTLTLDTGAVLAYDDLVLAQGTRELPAFGKVLTFGAHAGELSGLLADIESGSTGSVAFVVPDGVTWALPLYELALMTAQEAWAMNMDRVELHLVTPEEAPLEVFGPAASAALRGLLDTARIRLHCGVHAQVTESGDLELGGGGELLRVERIVALPVLEGIRIDGVAADRHGFVPVDDAGRVRGLPDVYAVGDVTDRPVKQGGLACQQADVTAAHIARRAGAAVELPALEQVLRGRLMTGGADRFLRDGPGSEASTEPLWWPPAKVSGAYLTPDLAALDLVHLPVRPSAPGVDVDTSIAQPA